MGKLLFFFILIGFLAPQSAYSIDSCTAIVGSFGHPPSTDLYFIEKLGKVEEHSIRKDQTAAHIYFDSTSNPYLFVAFPAGNSGVGLWFKGQGHLESVSAPIVIERPDGLNGIEIQGKAGTKNLKLDDSVLGSMRFIRDRELGIKAPPEVSDQILILIDGKLILSRPSLNGLARYVIEIEPVDGTVIVQNGSSWELVSKNEVKFKLRAFTSEPPLTPRALTDIFKESALKTMDRKKLEAFSFLLYREKLMAGSPRYFSKFGRDSIFTLRVLMDSMKPEAIEDLLTATLSSMHPTKGFVSHEQHEGDFASYVRLKQHKKYKGINTPIEDYKMIDADFAFTAVLADYMLAYPERARDFLDRTDQRGLNQRALVKNLFNHVIKSTTAFAAQPVYKNLVGLKGHEKTGQWRDSENGLGGGKYPFDVNAALVPAALRAMLNLSSDQKSGFFDYALSTSLSRSLAVWNTQVVRLFEVHVPKETARRLGERYLRNKNIDQVVIPPTEDIVFPAISLNENGKPIPIMHSDDSLMMTFGFPSAEFLKTVVQRVETSFPYGLRTPVGILVANAVFASPDPSDGLWTPAGPLPRNPVVASPHLQSMYEGEKYHGMWVSWTMQEDLLVYGIRRELPLIGLTTDLRHDLMQSEKVIEKIAASKVSMGGTEVYYISYKNGRYEAVPFAGDAKSNSNQLWSHLPLGFTWTRP